MMNKIERIILEYRKKDLSGKLVDLSPVTEDDLFSIIKMRNNAKMMHSFNQDKELTIDDQKIWYENYKQRKNDLYWMIKDKNGVAIGTNRIYDITSKKCEQGSLMIDTKYSRTAPFAIEAIMICLDFAFEVLGVNTVINNNRHDNNNMNSLSKRFGFKFLRETDVRGAIYNYYELKADDYKRDEVNDVLQLWINR